MKVVDIIVQFMPLVGMVGGIAGLMSWAQSRHSDQRDAWWERTRWAIEQVKSQNSYDQIMGIQALEAISQADMGHAIDDDLFGAIYRRAKLVFGPTTDAIAPQLRDTTREAGGDDND